MQSCTLGLGDDLPELLALDGGNTELTLGGLAGAVTTGESACTPRTTPTNFIKRSQVLESFLERRQSSSYI